MTVYLDIGVVRVQTYLGRWPQLAGRRAASTLLARAFDPGDLGATIAGRAHVNRAAGDVDSTISLVVDEQVDVAALADDVLGRLRHELPAAEFEATWAAGPDYLVAHQEIAAQRAMGRSRVSLPLANGFPLLALCSLCGIDPAVASRRHHDGQIEVCADCLQRIGVSTSPPAELRLQRELGKPIATDFAALAALGSDAKRNHVATVYADGNAFGAFFAALARSRADKETVSRQLHEVTWTALVDAAAAVSDDTATSRVLPHVVGGDDVLVSVPASHAWAFTRTFLRRFNSLTAEVVRPLEQLGELPVPSSSAAIVIAHASWPFATAADVAADLLARAKRAGRGAISTVGWLEVTRRGGSADDALAPQPLDTVEAWAEHLDELCLRLTTAARHTIEHQLDAPAHTLPEEEVLQTARRLGVKDLLWPRQRDDAPPWQLRPALDISRWWSPT